MRAESIAGILAVVLVVSACGEDGRGAEKTWSWQTPHAEVDPKGDLRWKPHKFVFEAGASVRYIDYERGRDTNPGTKTQPWKHHPWDPQAGGKAAACRGIHTYVFKRGVIYRGTLTVSESGRPGDPIRLTSDPSWGGREGVRSEAVICGSEKVSGWKKGADHKDIPEPGKVWYADLDFAPRSVWMIKGEEVTRIPLARMPNWKASDPEDVKSEWWYWDYPTGRYFNVFMKNERGKELVLGIDTKNLTGPKELYMGAIAWTEFGWVDGTPYPSHVQGFDGAKKGIGFEGLFGSARSRIICRGHRYYLEDLPRYLDDPDGEFWFHKKGDGGRLYIRLPGGRNPNSVTVEAGKDRTLIHMEDKSHVYVSGLAFRYTNVSWDLTELPWGRNFALKSHVYPACVRVWGGGFDIRVSNCVFEYVNCGVFMKAVKPGHHIDEVAVTDCEFRETDHGGITIQEGIQWGHTLPERAGHLFDVKVLRNYLYRTGLRSRRVGASNAIDVSNGQTVEIAGNIAERPWHAGINVRCAKISHNVRDCHLSRVLIHHNKVTDGIRTGDDCANIETWQGGPAYVYNNVSGNPGGFRNCSWMFGKDDKNKPGCARFGMAYYLDGGFKNYFFNNIGWGLSKDPWSRVGATTMFQEIISYENTFFNNTAYNFVKGTRRQAPQAGRNKFLGNIWHSIGDWVFWHTKPARTAEDGNERDAGPQGSHYALETNAFSGNIFFDITGKYGSFKPSGRWHESFEDARRVLEEVKSIAYDLGEVAGASPLKDAANHDFRLADGSAAIDKGVKVFVPWSLYAMVGEWNFCRMTKDPTRIMDEHWYMAPYYYTRGDYYKKPMFPLTGENIGAEDYVEGPLEDWTEGALGFNGKDQYAVCSNDKLSQTFKYTIKFRWEKSGQEETRTVTGKDFKSPQVYDTNFLIEVYFKTEAGHAGGVLVEKMSGNGYSLSIDTRGRVAFEVKGAGGSGSLTSRARVNDGGWHHVIAEADRKAGTLTLYVDGRKDATAAGVGADVSLANSGDLHVGGTPRGRCLEGTFDFLRIALGTIADAKTTIEELCAWQFHGPFLRDFTGRKPTGAGRDAGAIEKAGSTPSRRRRR